MALSLAKELLGSLQLYDYRKCIPYISIGSGVSHAEYETRDEYSRWQIDTSLTFRGKKCKTVNPDMLFIIFGRYSGDEPRVVRASMIKWIKENYAAFDKATFIGMIGKDIELDSWLRNMESTRTVGDEFALYALCRLFNRHARVITRGNTWHTITVEGSLSDRQIEDACDIHLLFIARNTIAELKRPITGGTPLLTTPTPTQPNARPLRLENTDPPDASIWKLPDETVEYSDNLGNLIPLPRGDVDIPQDLLQNEPPIDDPPIEPAKDNRSRPLTIPCSINLRRLDVKDVKMWSPKPILNKILPDATQGTRNIDPESELNHYNLRDHGRKVQRNPVRNRPQRTASKPITYAESMDDSSQDSQIIGTVYTLDSRPPPNSATEKIIGLSEPSTYRLSAQNYIQAKRRGELPLPPTQTLPGFKTKKSEKDEDKPEQESTDSEATVLIEPPVLPDRRNTDNAKKGQLQIKKICLKKTRPKKNRIFKCTKCVSTFDSIASLNEHFIEKHRKLKCEECERSFDKPRSFTKHKYQHKKSKHVCDTCGKGFAFSSQLTAHLPSHGARLHRCDKPKCNKSFTHAGDLKKHQKTHTKKWWRCTVAGCTYKNRDKRNLKSHKISHTTSKGFCCRYCDKLFQWSMQLVRHYRKNTCVNAKRSDSPTF